MDRQTPRRVAGLHGRARKRPDWGPLVTPHPPLSPRHQSIVQTVLDHHQVTTSQITRLHFYRDGTDRSRPTRVQRTLRSLVLRGAIKRMPGVRWVGGFEGGSGSYVYIPPTSAARSRRMHTHDIVELRVQLAMAQHDGLCGPVVFHPEEQAALRVGMTPLRPDARVQIRLGDNLRDCFIEVDEGSEWGQKIPAKLRAYSDARQQWTQGRFPAVVFVVPDEARASYIQRKVAEHGDTELFRITQLDEAARYLTT
ncbi:replication-relaxation family protein [Streptomyces turgidiscabies]|nr:MULTISPECIES: replication-relaxation family protein [Streptomyces]MDX3494544.1 replication-relaxation family protein [Streptomyces turgidiscabies]